MHSIVVINYYPHPTASDGPLTVVIDSADVLCADLESPSKAYALIVALFSTVLARPSMSHRLFPPLFFFAADSSSRFHSLSEPSRLILHFSTHSPLRDLILTPRLSPTIAHITAHSPALLVHLAIAQLTPPPPASTPERFWRIFAPLSARTWEVEQIVLGPGCAGPNDEGEIVLEVLTRAPEGRGRNIERELEGWTVDGPRPLSGLDSLKRILEDKGQTGPTEVSKRV
jgi:hypothetical protein